MWTAHILQIKFRLQGILFFLVNWKYDCPINYAFAVSQASTSNRICICHFAALWISVETGLSSGPRLQVAPAPCGALLFGIPEVLVVVR